MKAEEKPTKRTIAIPAGHGFKTRPLEFYHPAEAEAYIAHLEQRAEAAEAKLAEYENQKPIGRVDRGAATDSDEYPDAHVVCLHEHVGWEAFQDGCELFTRPAPAVSLAELVPKEVSIRQAIAALENHEWCSTPASGYKAGVKDAISAILRNIEEAK